MENPEHVRCREPSEDATDPYDGVDLSTLPTWWQQAIADYEAHNFRPYRPPRFEDGVLKFEVIESLEHELSVRIQLFALNPTYGDDWSLIVDGVHVGEIGRHRSVSGYTIFEMSSGDFAELVRNHVETAT